jgi:hypothetical protein
MHAMNEFFRRKEKKKDAKKALTEEKLEMIMDFFEKEYAMEVSSLFNVRIRIFGSASFPSTKTTPLRTTSFTMVLTSFIHRIDCIANRTKKKSKQLLNVILSKHRALFVEKQKANLITKSFFVTDAMLLCINWFVLVCYCLLVNCALLTHSLSLSFSHSLTTTSSLLHI